MKTNWDYCFDLVIKSEGGYVNNPKDPGGETNLGVTKGAWSSYLARPIQDGEMANLTKEDVKPFYKLFYWDKLLGDDLPKGLDYMAFDFGVNAGPKQSTKFMQRAVGAIPDGIMGSGTLGLIVRANLRNVLLGISNQKEMFYRDIVARKPEQAIFLDGWLNRIKSVEATALAML